MVVMGLTDTSVEKGAELTLKVGATGTGPLQFKFYKDGVLLRSAGRTSIRPSEDGNCQFLVRDVGVSDEGLYRCIIENEWGQTSTLGSVTVTAAKPKFEVAKVEGEEPKFTTPLEDTNCAIGANVELECRVTGKPEPTLKWMKDGASFITSHRCQIQSLGDGRYKLTIRDAKESDEGTYRVVATNDFGTTNSRATLKVGDQLDLGAGIRRPGEGQPKIPRFITQPNDVRATEGNPIKIECKVDGQPMPEIQWIKDGEIVKPSDRVKIEQLPDGTCRLSIDSCNPDDAGTYRIVATSPQGSANAKSNVHVKSAAKLEPIGPVLDLSGKERAPKFIQPLDHVKGVEGQSITLACKVTGQPRPTIKWTKDGERFYPFGRIAESYCRNSKISTTNTVILHLFSVSNLADS